MVAWVQHPYAEPVEYLSRIYARAALHHRSTDRLLRQLISTNTPWERLAGFSRAVRVGKAVYVAGTTASNESGDLQGGQDAYAQTVYVLHKIEAALGAAGATRSDVVRTRIYVARMEDWQAAARAHGEFFGDIRPANTLVQVAGLIGDYLVEIEADAVVGD